MLDCHDLTFHYTRCDPGETPDFRFAFRLAPGECLSVEGPSGSGKSTLLALLAGFLEPGGGRLDWTGEDLLARPPWERGITTVFQEHNLFDHLPVWLNVGLGLAPDMKLTREQKRRIREGLAEVGLEGLHDRLPDELSGGQRQRVALLRALLRGAPLLLLDEPFTGLDDATRRGLWALVRRQKAAGVAVLLVSHDRDDIEALADRRCRLEGGRLVAVGD
ncbi:MULTISPECIES: ATP-binding cassette domain-containing protein [Halomonas]|uniref:Thiamine import ATP-binding protein ThiQ n=1 Tax=Halomonas halophila TaxID=29573 RepID=A0ABQ0U6H6_9GAMM|nr:MULTISPECIES: ATP-binding cassette domain-containing protein [Halomonas]MDR5888883.1 ATP-binding cassette domain-containing protein [Halomonas salina]RAH38596.1 ATP-binding cassette domain-containing protein [Halomonas sp. SL1]WJY08060.1 ATP-binding cassette domain-containing protein [Halomonas halophila]GEK73318.1 thiamine import ATP-binding protein ThiQ [Halomonas halophila]